MEYKEILLKDLKHDELKELFGINNHNITLLSQLLGFEIIARGECLKVNCEKQEYLNLVSIIDCLINKIKNNEIIDDIFIKQVINNINNQQDISWQNKTAITTNSGKPIKYKTYNQYLLTKTIEENDLVFSIGPAGTGKTFFAVLMACKAYKDGEIKKIILTRPAVEAGESLGFLPGDLKEKIDPYLMPLYDSLYDILGKEQVDKLMEKNIIEVIPLAYMRGRTLNEAYIILDEAQNTSSSQILMFLTRLGNKSKMIINGDVTQIDLKISSDKSGLVIAEKKLKNIKNIEFVYFNSSDVVRHPLVEKIIERFTN